jgi:hypothetical protein
VTHKISTTMQPGVPLEVEEAEYHDLKRQGLIATDDSEEAELATAPAPDQAAAPAPAVTSKAVKPAMNKEG